MEVGCAVKNVRGPFQTLGDAMGSQHRLHDDCIEVYVKIHLDDKGRTALEANRTQATELMLMLAKSNCEAFLSRTFANERGLSFWRSSLSNLGNAAAGATAFASAGVSAAISATNIVVGAHYDAFDATYLGKQALPAILEEIRASTNKKETEIRDNLAGDKPNHRAYSILTAIADIRSYGSLCSLENGVRGLTEKSFLKKSNNDQESNVEPSEAQATTTPTKLALSSISPASPKKSNSLQMFTVYGSGLPPNALLRFTWPNGSQTDSRALRRTFVSDTEIKYKARFTQSGTWKVRAVSGEQQSNNLAFTVQ